MEGGVTFGWAKLAAALKDVPLWLFTAVALSMTLLITVPEFRAQLFPSGPLGLFLTLVAWIFVLARSTIPAIRAWRLWRATSRARMRFVITPVEHQCIWGVSKQTDGTVVTQVSGHFMVKNRADSPLYLMTARLVRPRIRGEVLPGLLAVRAIDDRTYGTAHTSGHCIPPHETVPVSATILIRGTPRQRSGMLQAIVEMSDADGHRERVRVCCRYFGIS